MTEEKKDLTVQEKKEVVTEKEHTFPGKKYLPHTDIVETENALLVYMDMPGVAKDKVHVELEKNVLAVDGEIESGVYSDLKPLYTEYNVGHFTRRFELSNEINQAGIEAKIVDGVLLLTLPKVPEKQAMNIRVN
ncbi:MAG: Hsp20/alpha crystallin family protein [Proteobacteria bacterium]|nr:Hsp20/alpha crystallin family protein [Pseudomonadota bacterium]